MNRSVPYVSTRGGEIEVRFSEAMLRGLAPDGGLYVPSFVPALASTGTRVATFARYASEILDPWIGDEFGPGVLNQICADAFDFDIKLVAIDGGPWADCHVLELFHGPTFSFKDFGARFMARAMAQLVKQSGDRVTLLVATSGDTGSAVADGFSGLPGVRVVLVYPEGGVSPLQERQLTVRREGVTVFRVPGSFDDCQRLVKGAFAAGSPSGIHLSTANSINVGRLLPQMIYYSWAVAHLDERPDISVPCGNLGNLTAGILAGLSGMSSGTWIASHNANAFFPEYLSGPGSTFRPSLRTLSNAMDVGAPSNFERLVHLLERQQLTRMISGYSISDSETIRSIRKVYEATGYLADPHTAVAFSAVERHRIASGMHRPTIIVSTAHPAKFGDTVEKAVGIRPDIPLGLAKMEGESTDVRDMVLSQGLSTMQSADSDSMYYSTKEA